jgi:hypothetical protein
VPLCPGRRGATREATEECESVAREARGQRLADGERRAGLAVAAMEDGSPSSPFTRAITTTSSTTSPRSTVATASSSTSTYAATYGVRRQGSRDRSCCRGRRREEWQVDEEVRRPAPEEEAKPVVVISRLPLEQAAATAAAGTGGSG